MIFLVEAVSRSDYLRARLNRSQLVIGLVVEEG